MSNRRTRYDRLRADFALRYGRPPSHWVRAPGRVDAMGSHTDYNGGFVLTLSIDLDTWIAASPRSDGRVHVESSNLEGAGDFAADDVMVERAAGWPIYFQAVAGVLAREGYGVSGCDVLVNGTLPIASGLSSSASLEAATAMLFSTLAGHELDKLEMALLCQRAENEIVGVDCGILDQYSSILGEAGRALLLDCRHLTHEYVSIPEDLQAVVCNTRVRRELSGSEYGDRRASCEAGARALADRIENVSSLRDVEIARFEEHENALPALLARRCRFVIEENLRVGALGAALQKDDRSEIGRLCAASFAGARDLFEITIPAMESMYEAMTRAPGVVGARQAGAGFGGCMLAFVEARHTKDFVAATADAYASATGTLPEIDPVQSAAGAGLLDVAAWREDVDHNAIRP